MPKHFGNPLSKPKSLAGLPTIFAIHQYDQHDTLIVSLDTQNNESTKNNGFIDMNVPETDRCDK